MCHAFLFFARTSRDMSGHMTASYTGKPKTRRGDGFVRRRPAHSHFVFSTPVMCCCALFSYIRAQAPRLKVSAQAMPISEINRAPRVLDASLQAPRRESLQENRKTRRVHGFVRRRPYAQINRAPRVLDASLQAPRRESLQVQENRKTRRVHGFVRRRPYAQAPRRQGKVSAHGMPVPKIKKLLVCAPARPTRDSVAASS